MISPGRLIITGSLSPSTRPIAIRPAKTPGSNQERMPTSHSQATIPVPKTMRCAGSVTWRISSGQCMFGTAIDTASRKAKAQTRITPMITRSAVIALPLGAIRRQLRQ